MKTVEKLGLAFALLVILSFSIGCDNSPNQQGASAKIIVQNYYWAKHGMEEQVYQQRLLASAVREKYGHPVGKVLRLKTASDSLPDVIWECEYGSMKSREKDVERLAKNEEFSRIADKMGTLIEKFDRAIYNVGDPLSRTE